MYCTLFLLFPYYILPDMQLLSQRIFTFKILIHAARLLVSVTTDHKVIKSQHKALSIFFIFKNRIKKDLWCLHFAYAFLWLKWVKYILKYYFFFYKLPDLSLLPTFILKKFFKPFRLYLNNITAHSKVVF